MAKPTRGGNKTTQPKQSQPQIQPKEDPVLGPKGDPINPDVALANVNKDNYNKGRGYQINCQRCVWAYELQRRGYDVEALPNNDRFGAWPRWVNEVLKNKTWDDFIDVTPREGQKDSIVTVRKNIENQMKEWGDGARAIVRIYGHVFNVEQIGGKTVVMEAQIGEVETLREALGGSRARLNRSVTAMMRTDDVVFKDDLSNVVKRRKS